MKGATSTTSTAATTRGLSAMFEDTATATAPSALGLSAAYEATNTITVTSECVLPAACEAGLSTVSVSSTGDMDIEEIQDFFLDVAPSPARSTPLMTSSTPRVTRKCHKCFAKSKKIKKLKRIQQRQNKQLQHFNDKYTQLKNTGIVDYIDIHYM